MVEPLSPVTSLQCIDALCALGFTIVESNARRVHLVGSSDGRRVFVARHRVFNTHEVRTILFLAGIDEAPFVAAVARRTSRRPPPPEHPGASSGIRRRDEALAGVEAFLETLRQRKG
jgi:hypothetical protein